MPKKTLGIVFIVIALLLALSFIGLANSWIGAIAGLTVAISNKDTDVLGFSLGLLIYWIAHVTVMIILWRYGMRWVRAKPIRKQGQ